MTGEVSIDHAVQGRRFLGPPRNPPIITLWYPRRFRRGKCIVVMTIPMEAVTLTMLKAIGRVYGKPPHNAVIIGNGCGSGCVRIVHPLPTAVAKESQNFQKLIGEVAAQAHSLLQLPTIVSPIKGMIEMKQRFHAFD